MNHLKYSVSTYSIYLIACPALANWKSGGYSCKRCCGCINRNKGYLDFEIAWEECGKIGQCGKIMKYSDGKFYLRRLDDEYKLNSNLEYVDYFCGGKKTKNFTKLFILLHIKLLANVTIIRNIQSYAAIPAISSTTITSNTQQTSKVTSTKISSKISVSTAATMKTTATSKIQTTPSFLIGTTL